MKTKTQPMNRLEIKTAQWRTAADAAAMKAPRKTAQTSHTPGPWTNNPAFTPNGRPVIAREIVAGIRHIADVRLYEDADTANARLIAAAPDMKNALQQVDSIMSNDLGADVWEASNAGKIVRAAIAKATGNK